MTDLHDILQRIRIFQAEANTILAQPGGAQPSDQPSETQSARQPGIFPDDVLSGDTMPVKMIVHSAFYLEIYPNGAAYLNIRGDGYLDPLDRQHLIKALVGAHLSEDDDHAA